MTKEYSDIFNINELDWSEKLTSRGYVSDADVTITKGHGKNSPAPRVNFTFRNDVDKLLTTTSFLVVAIKKNRMFFREADGVHGYKVSHLKTPNSAYMAMSSTGFSGLDFIGDYELKFDPFYELYYIEKGENNGK